MRTKKRKLLSNLALTIMILILRWTMIKYFLQMFDISERLVYYVNAIEGNSAVLAKLRANTEKINLSQHQIYYLDDIIHDNAQSGRQSNIYSSVLSGLMDARGNVINNN